MSKSGIAYPTDEEKVKMHRIVEEMTEYLKSKDLTPDHVIKIITATTVSMLAIARDHHEVPKEAYNAWVDYYANASTAVVKYLRDGTQLESDTQLVNGSSKKNRGH